MSASLPQHSGPASPPPCSTMEKALEQMFASALHQLPGPGEAAFTPLGNRAVLGEIRVPGPVPEQWLVGESAKRGSHWPLKAGPGWPQGEGRLGRAARRPSFCPPCLPGCHPPCRAHAVLQAPRTPAAGPTLPLPCSHPLHPALSVAPGAKSKMLAKN